MGHQCTLYASETSPVLWHERVASHDTLLCEMEAAGQPQDWFEEQFKRAAQ